MSDKALLLCLAVILQVWSSAASLQEVAESNLQFASSIYKELSTSSSGNLLFSPLSIQVILALTSLGARGQTASQMVTGLKLPTGQDRVKQGFEQLLATLQANSEVTLSLANRIFVDRSFRLRPEFSATAKASFSADAVSVDFVRSADAERLAINKWVEQKTGAKIKELLKSGMITSSTALVLVNAVYFLGKWVTEFDANKTDVQKFYVTPAQTRDVTMMHASKTAYGFDFNSQLDCQLLELPYQGDRLSMVILLPRSRDGLRAMEAKLSDVNLGQVLSQLRQVKLDVSLPRFSLQHEFNLNQVLVKLGMTAMFSDNADFSALADGRVSVSNVVHKAFVEVDERGTTAAAVTGVTSGRSGTLRFTADHPFVFLLRDRPTRAILFMGRYTGP